MRPVLFLSMLLLLPLVAIGAERGTQTTRQYQLDVSFDISLSKVFGTVTFSVRPGEEIRLLTGQLTVTKMNLNGKEVSAAVRDGQLRFLPAQDGVLTVGYEGLYRGGDILGDRNYGVVSSTIDSRGISLTGLWYPRPEGLAVWKLRALLPQGYEAVSEADAITKEEKAGGVQFFFDFPYPVDGLSLVATNRYEVTRERHGSVELFAYFFPEDRELARTYLQSVKRYLDLYEKMLVPYPYRRFSVVENFLPTGYSMPTFTLLGQDVVRLPFITETSLGHEVLHQWFGCSVFEDREKGNWTEGLTTYLADHWYDEQKGRGWEYRKQLLVNYAAYVNDRNDFPLREFRSRMDQASRAIGYGKSAMVFHMIRNRMGDEAFFAALRDVIRAFPFREAAWDDFETAFEKRSGKDLTAFFSEWIGGKGLPEITIETASIRRLGNRFEITITLVRKNGAIPLDLPVLISFLRGGSKKETITVDADRKTVNLIVDDEPSTAILDGDYDVARRPTPDEIPPVIARLMGEEKPLIVLPVADRGPYRAVVEEFTRKGGVEKEEASLKDADVRSSSLVILGRDNPVAARLFGRIDLPEQGFSITIRKNPWNASKVVAVIHTASNEETAPAFEKVFHYGKYSSLAFEKGRNRSKKIDPAERGIVLLLREDPAVLDLGILKKFASLVEAAREKRIVYIGEFHDRFSHHTVQVQLIQALHAQDPRIAVGMEMFQRPFQGTLDDYIAGNIDEREFLRRSEYFRRWGFDYNLYKPILDFCRKEKVPVVALNIRREITEKAAKGGLDALTDDERKELPREMDLSDREYRDRIRRAFDQHREPGERNFDFFLQAQVLWDETMAEAVDEYLRRNPDRRMVVVAGGGHVVYGSGIPKRSFRRNGFPYLIVLNDGDIEPGIADYLIFPPSLDGMIAPRLLATFREEGGRFVFTDFVDTSPAKAAGIRMGDALLALDGVPVSTIEDIKLALFYKSKGDTVLATVVRQRFLLGEKVMTLEVRL